jgi:hypothetical protein
MALFFNILPILNYTAGYMHGNASVGGRKPDAKYTYSFLGTSTLFSFGYAANIKPPVHPLLAITASIFATGGMFCMGHMTARMVKDT